MKKLMLFILLVMSCNKKIATTTNNMDAPFEKLKGQFLESLWETYPDWAMDVGYHKYDSVLIVPDAASRSREISFANNYLDSLKKFDLTKLSDNNKTDYYLIENTLKRILWAINDQKSYEWNPSEYNVSGSFAGMLNNNYDSLDTRLSNFYLRMKNIPAYYDAAKANIKNPTEEHRQLAIDQNLGGTSVFEADLKEALAKSKLSQDRKKEIEDRGVVSVKVMKDFASWLKAMKNDSPRSFRLGEKLYTKKFEYDIHSGNTVEQIYEKAVAHKKDLHEKMSTLADQLWGKYMGNAPKPSEKLKLIKDVIDKVSEKHVSADSFQTAIEKQIPELVEFVKNKNLLYLDPSKPLVVRKEPAYMAGVAGASITAPGPYDKNGNTYYNVGSLSGWSKERSESYLREYNHYILQILNIHEAVPGHYAQLVYSNQSPSLIKSILGNGAMIEGWAVYTELMMLENGYGNNEPEMWLMYYKWNLRATCNTILDYSVHVKNMNKEDALNLLINEAFQQKAEAEGKWRRVSVTQVQLCSYFTGYSEIYDLREELKKKMGDKFNLKTFHEKFLSYGSAPVKYVRELMLKDLK